MSEDDPINFRQAMQSSNSHKWIEAMNEKYKSMQDNKVWELVPLPDGVKPDVVNGYLKLKGIQMVMWRGIRHVLWPKALLKRKELTSKRLYLQFLRKTLLGQLWRLLHILILSCIKWMSKQRFSMVTLKKPFIWCSQKTVSGDPKNMVCKLTKSIYGLKQASRQWYFKFHQVIASYGFETN